MASKHEKQSDEWTRAILESRYNDLFEAYQALVNPSSKESSPLPDSVVEDLDVQIRTDRDHGEMDHVKRRPEEMNEDLAHKVRKLEDETQQLKSVPQNSQSRNQELEEERDHLQEDNNDLENRNKHLEDDIQTQQNILEEVLAENDRMRVELEGYHEARDAPEIEQLAIVMKRNADLENQLKQMDEMSRRSTPPGDNHDLYDSPGSPNHASSHNSETYNPKTLGDTIKSDQSQLDTTDGADARLESDDDSSQSKQWEGKPKENSPECQKLRNAMMDQEQTIEELKSMISNLEDDLDSTMNQNCEWENACSDWEARYAGLDADWREMYNNLKMEYAKPIKAEIDARSEVKTGEDPEEELGLCIEKYKALEEENSLLRQQIISKDSLREQTQDCTPISETCVQKCQEWEEKYNDLVADYDELKTQRNPYDLEYRLEQALADKESFAYDRDHWHARYISLLADCSYVQEQHDSADVESPSQAEKGNKHVDAINPHNESGDVQESSDAEDEDDDDKTCRKSCKRWEAMFIELEEKYGSLVTEWTALKARNLELLDENLVCWRKQGVLGQRLDKLADAVLSSVRRE
ncbi:predicted protein [Plenodomus lingam JN3]|uniref:Predicted protein n=1 Tax=Leptosphaeria maculans (strain JN3 / isolate v23.1.3 / race Av1-4-5-6-7-8) TaxID=985895 RepID=E5ADP6_LEPMJ|nr:predicted protein [Plenodomus lingam JN3]CBY01335.1 predicted protein [Plenodomus lingam JN3]